MKSTCRYCLAGPFSARLGERKPAPFFTVPHFNPTRITRVFEYKMFTGQPASSPFWQMLQHLVNHGSYHRGQVTTKLRQLGAQPAKSLDMIAFYRSQAAAARG